jgi:PAS domain S-box-containing protein
MEESHRKSEAMYRELFDHMSSGVAVYQARDDGSDFMFADINRAGEKISHVRKHDILGKSVIEVFPDVKEMGLFEVLQRVHKSGCPEILDVSLYQDARISHWARNYVYKLPSGEIVAIYDDVTEHKRVGKELGESEERYRRIVETANEGIWAMDEAFKTTFVNGQMALMLGYQVEEMLGRTVGSFMCEDELTDHQSKMQDRIQGLDGVYERRFRRKDGGECWCIVSAKALHDSQGRFAGSFAMFTDITERKRAEQELMATLLEKEVLLREIHHRVKNNMQVIMSLLNNQARQFDDPLLSRALQETCDRIRSLAFIHERLYKSNNFARIDFGNYIEDLVPFLSRSYGRREVTLSIKTREVVLALDTAIPLALISNELVTNALKYAFPGGRAGTITIELRAGSENNAIFTVRDDGIGLPEHIDIEESPTFGLQLVNDLVKQIDGTIELSRDGGTAFTIRLKTADSPVTPGL